jgi:Xaa-Pro aminopeptidase
VFGFDEAYPTAELDARMPDLIANQRVLHTPVGLGPAWDARVAGWLNAVRAQGAHRRHRARGAFATCARR